MKKVLVWETSAAVAGGQKMTLAIMDLLKESYAFHCLIPAEGPLSAELQKRNIPYTLMGDQSMPSGVKGRRVYFQYAWLSVKNIIGSLRVIRRFRPELLYAPGPASLPWSAVCGTLTGKPVIWHLHHLFLDGPTKKLLNFTCRWKAVKSIISISQIVGDQITHPVGHAKLQCIYNPVDADKYASGDPSKLPDELQTLLSRKEDALVLMETGVIRKIKCQDLFVRVVEALKARNVPVVGILVGDAITEDDQAYREALLQQIRNGGLWEDIYLAGHRENVQDYLAAADILFVPGMEGLSLVALEAMAARCDIIATEAGGVGELLREADCGCLYPENATAGQIAELILEARAADRREKLENGYRFSRTQSLASYGQSIQKCFMNNAESKIL